MSPLLIELSVLDARHARALGLHWLALDDDDRYARFGQCLSDDALLNWVRRINWDSDIWMGAWCGAEDLLLGAVQLAPTRHTWVWELSLTVAASIRRRGVGTDLLAAALREPGALGCRTLQCHHGHPALRIMAGRLGLGLSEHRGESGVALHR
ncbi:GNAT family N-acetyltransferase [Hydrogenophaga sp. RWCD_12]|uniref:GNAT family N-acetyltransferase n=1 Tax=Hydrogenophaga sp. RWCD_12 TaxID=3391190 RepID=UPI003984C288